MKGSPAPAPKRPWGGTGPTTQPSSHQRPARGPEKEEQTGCCEAQHGTNNCLSHLLWPVSSLSSFLSLLSRALSLFPPSCGSCFIPVFPSPLVLTSENYYFHYFLLPVYFFLSSNKFPLVVNHAHPQKPWHTCKNTQNSNTLGKSLEEKYRYSS